MKHARSAGVIVLCLLLSGCAGLGDAPPNDMRQAVYGMSGQAAEALLESPPWSGDTQNMVVMLAPPTVDATFNISAARLTETLGRALLAQAEGPQVLDWTPGMMTDDAPDNHWILESRLNSNGVIRLTDRELLPYQWEITLRRPGNDAPSWRATLSGALDASAL
ncbi:hypothetical protein BTW10_07045 [Chromohalobacter japonicus]|uniref:DUF3261 domain-containing protein n=2 Tax=Chromohalobacter TaxID=42054 RepID=A0A1Q8TE44_9GAMM|nr:MULTISPECIES: hypothetical protein [Chromohalobacter]MCT8505731.1 hypothetical protein [Chromohalobacter moromii]OLO11946.1 hypothetical protein BTW10_07045 [Chromohalobacter japonicus]